MDLFNSILEGATVEVRTKFTPPISYELGGESILGPHLQPVFTIKRNGDTIAEHAPYGYSERNYWPIAATALIVLSVVLFAIFRK